jgi:hypothetical protein
MKQDTKYLPYFFSRVFVSLGNNFLSFVHALLVDGLLIFILARVAVEVVGKPNVDPHYDERDYAANQ